MPAVEAVRRLKASKLAATEKERIIWKKNDWAAPKHQHLRIVK